MRRTTRHKFAVVALFLAAMVALMSQGTKVWAHGGEDHGDKKPAAVSTGTNMVARVVRVGEYEVTIKHPNAEPGQEALAKVFVTHFETNEPVGDAKIAVLVDDAAAGGPVEIAALPTTTPGIYEVKLPPMAQGECKLSARVEVGGESLIANYGAMQVMVAPVEAGTGIALWARTALIFLGVLITLGVLGVAGLFAFRHFRRNRINEQSPTAA